MVAGTTNNASINTGVIIEASMGESAEEEQNLMPMMDWVSNDLIINEVSPDDKEGRLLAREKIEHFQEVFQAAVGSETGSMDEINDNGLVEHFAGGSYTRGLLIPKENIIVSRIWKKERTWIIATGEVTFTTEMGTQRVKAPYTAVIPSGSKVILYTHEETLWFAVTGAETENPEDVEFEVLAEDYCDCVYPWDRLEDKS